MADPVLTSINPTSAAATGGLVTLHCIGSNFTAACEILWNGLPLPATTFVSATELTGQVDPATATFDASNGQSQVAVRLAAITTPPKPFTILFGAPVLTSLVPNSIDISTGEDVDVTVNGSNFWTHTQLLADGSPIACQFVSATQLRATVATAAVTGAGTMQMQLKTASQSSVATLPLTLTGEPYVPPEPPAESASPNTEAIPAEYMSPEPPDVYRRVAEGDY
jgi:hypothetical protein